MHAKAAHSSFRDRTYEFQSVAERLKKSLSSGPGQNGPSSGLKSKSEEQRSAVAIQSEFNKRASKIGYGIHQTSQKLGKLTKLAKRTSVFDDPTREIQELTAVIKQDITALNSAVVDLQHLSNSRNQSGNFSSDTSSHSTTVVDDLKNRLMSATKEFKEVLTMRTENLKVHENRRQLFSATASKDAANPFVRQRPLAARSAASSSSASPPPWVGSPSSSQAFPKKQMDGESQPLLQQQQQQQQQELVPVQDSYMQSRAEALQNVESTIHELSNIFNQLATLVSQQGEVAIRIDENMEDTLANVEGAQGALLKYLNSISSNSQNYSKIFFIRSNHSRDLDPDAAFHHSRDLQLRVSYSSLCSQKPRFRRSRVSDLTLVEGFGRMHAKATQSSFRDRTHEFQSVAERLKKSFSSGPGQNGPSSGLKSKSEEQRSAVAIQSEFNKRASKIGYGIHQTSQKLGKLTKLAKRTSVFDDPTREIQELTAVIKQDITALNSAVVDLQHLSNSRNQSGNISSDTSSHSTTVVDDLKNRLMSATKEFKEVLTMRTENLKVHENRRQLFSATASKDAANPFVRQRPLAARSAASSSSASPPPWVGSPSSSQAFPKKQMDGESQPLLQQQQQQELVPVQDSYMQSRAEALQNVESTIHELSNIFNQLATLVSQQGEVAIRIDENMEDTLANVEGAQGALLKYLNSISSNRWLMIKIFFILIFFLMVFLFFVA
ncbi:hypothetical protein ACFX2I_016979 [Malus domestica]